MPKKNAALQGRHRVCKDYLLLFSHFGFATPQEVLQADWQEVWHSPQPPVTTLLVRSRVAIVLIRSIVENLSKLQSFAYSSLYTVLSLCMITRCADSVKIFVALSVKTLQVLTALPKGATATTAACGGNREELLGPRPARRKQRAADAGGRNPGAKHHWRAGQVHAKRESFAILGAEVPC